MVLRDASAEPCDAASKTPPRMVGHRLGWTRLGTTNVLWLGSDNLLTDIASDNSRSLPCVPNAWLQILSVSTSNDRCLISRIRQCPACKNRKHPDPYPGSHYPEQHTGAARSGGKDRQWWLGGRQLDCGRRGGRMVGDSGDGKLACRLGYYIWARVCRKLFRRARAAWRSQLARKLGESGERADRKSVV